MIRPLELFLALRYVRSREAGFFVSFITLVSLLGVALGVAALIAILSVMNGFEGDLRARLLSLSAHATLVRADGGPLDGERIAALARAAPGVAGAAPYIELQALLVHGAEMSSASLRGIDPATEGTVTAIGASMQEGRIADLVPGANRVVLGRMLASRLRVAVGDELTVMVPTTGEDGELAPRIRLFTVSGLFEVGMPDHDATLALGSMADVAALAHETGAAGVRLRYHDVFAAPAAARALAARLGPGYESRDWTLENASYFRAIRIEKTMMTLILLLVVAVAAFNIVAMLVMVVRAKRTDIAILRTLGLSPRGVVGAFLSQGLLIGWTGVLLGVALGVALAANASAVMAWLERTFRFRLFDSDVYYVTAIPSRIEVADVVTIAVVALVLTLAATIYPALRAARTEPADVLRYE